jgi:hypothetical protein
MLSILTSAILVYVFGAGCGNKYLLLMVWAVSVCLENEEIGFIF